jgi:murein DD-endopeptidase MepM/ murein hydrolase activator NlpD
MRACPSILLPFAFAALLAVASLAIASRTFAEPAPIVARGESSRGQRPIADDVRIDQYLAVAPAPKKPAAEVVQPPAAAEPEAEADDEEEPEMGIAALRPATRPLRTTFAPEWPARGVITTYFGEVGPLSPRGHAGIDIAAPVGTPIFAMDDGEIVRADFEHGAYGGLVIVAHVSGYETWYAHLSGLGVEPGEQVRRGEQIGRMGSTGMSTGSHLHFEVRHAGELRDPLSWLTEAELER